MVDTIRTQTDLITNLFKDGQNVGSITPNDMRDLIISVRSNQGGGWVFHVDAQQSDPGSDNLSSDTRTKITCDGGSGISQTGEINLLGANIWNTTTSLLIPAVDGDAYDCRFTFNFSTPSAASGQYIEIDLDIGAGGIGSGPIIYKELRPLLKGAGITQAFAFSIPLFAKPPFPANGGTFFITSSAAGRIWNTRIFINRIYTPAA